MRHILAMAFLMVAGSSAFASEPTELSLINFLTPFDHPANSPIIAESDKFCAQDNNGNFDGTTVQISSGLLAGGVAFAEGGGCVKRPIREVWAALNNIDALKWKAADRQSYERTVNPKPSFTHLYAVTYFKKTIIGTLDWTIQWYHAFDIGTFEKPERVNINYQRVSGTSNIPVWQGGVVLTRMTDTITSIAIRNEFKARQSSSDNEQSARDELKEMTDNARTVAPNWNNLDITRDHPLESVQ